MHTFTYMYALSLLLACSTAKLARADAPGGVAAIASVISEEALLDKELQPPDLGVDDTSLLQTSLRMQPPPPAPTPSLSDVPRHGFDFLNEPTAFPGPPDGTNIPQADNAWALYQHVPPGSVRLPLPNDTKLEPPVIGSISRNTSRIMESDLGIERSAPIYEQPQHFNNSRSADWVIRCMGNQSYSRFTSATLLLVAVPQLVPFIVPMHHPSRTDVSVIVLPGGGSDFLSWEDEGTDVAKWLNLQGISAFVLKYRVPGNDIFWQREDAVLDAQRAISLLRRVAPQLGLNSSRVGLFGASHGGWVSLLTAFSARRQYEARDSVDEQSPMPDFLLLLYPETERELLSRALSFDPVGESSGGLALSDLSNPMPIFIAHGEDDTCCTSEMLFAFHAALRLRGDPTVEINLYESVGHGFTMCYRQGLAYMHHEACFWMVRARRFIMWHVENKAPADVDVWFRRMEKFETSLLAANVSGAHVAT